MYKKPCYEKHGIPEFKAGLSKKYPEMAYEFGIRMNIAYEIENICVYSFTQYMIEKTKETYWIELAIDLMLHPLCFVEGAYSVALFHARD